MPFPPDPNQPRFPLANRRVDPIAGFDLNDPADYPGKQRDLNEDWLKLGPIALEAWVLRGRNVGPRT